MVRNALILTHHTWVWVVGFGWVMSMLTMKLRCIVFATAWMAAVSASLAPTHMHGDGGAVYSGVPSDPSTFPSVPISTLSALPAPRLASTRSLAALSRLQPPCAPFFPFAFWKTQPTRVRSPRESSKQTKLWMLQHNSTQSSSSSKVAKILAIL